MVVTDPIADYLTRLRNAISAKHKVVEIPASNLKKEMTKILMDKGYILNYKFEEDNKQGKIKIALKYNPKTKESKETKELKLVMQASSFFVRLFVPDMHFAYDTSSMPAKIKTYHGPSVIDHGDIKHLDTLTKFAYKDVDQSLSCNPLLPLVK